MNYTSIQISPRTRTRLAKFKEYGRETYDEVLNKLMSIVELDSEVGLIELSLEKALLLFLLTTDLFPFLVKVLKSSINTHNTVN